MIRMGEARIRCRLDDDPRQVDVVAGDLRPRVQPGEQQQVVDEPAHPPRLRADAGQGVGDLGGVEVRLRVHVRVPADGGERVP